MHTPRLCVDTRVAKELPGIGLVAQELVDQLIYGLGEQEASSPWVERHRTVLLAHPKQMFSGQLKRFDTQWKLGRTPFYWAWENNFVEHANISGFHRFRPIDRISPPHKVFTVTTVLPSKNDRLPFFLSRKPNHLWVVSSDAAQKVLMKRYGIDSFFILKVRPTVRRYVQFTHPPKRNEAAKIVFVLGSPKMKATYRKLAKVMRERYPFARQSKVKLWRKNDVSGQRWSKQLENARMCFYLADSPFDWPVLALEALYYKVPTIFSDGNAALSELLPDTALRLSQFLVEQPSDKVLEASTAKAHSELEKLDLFGPASLAKQYVSLYAKLPLATDLLSAPAVPATGCCGEEQPA